MKAALTDLSAFISREAHPPALGQHVDTCQSRCMASQMWWPPVHSSTGTGREEVMRKGGGEEARSVRAVCDVCAAHGDRAAVGVEVDVMRKQMLFSQRKRYSVVTSQGSLLLHLVSPPPIRVTSLARGASSIAAYMRLLREEN